MASPYPLSTFVSVVSMEFYLTIQNANWRATVDEDGHYCLAVAL
jgi:hypothetical protein